MWVYAEVMAAQSAPDYTDETSSAFDLAAPIDRAVDEAEHGKVIYLHRRERPTVAVMPAEIAEAALAALEDAEDAADVAASRARRAAGERGIPWEQLKAEINAELAQ